MYQQPYQQPYQAPMQQVYNPNQYGATPAAGAPGVAPINPEVQQWFMSVDQDRSGHINMNELQQALTNSNWSHFNAETCRLMIGMFDKNQSGQIDINEFQALWMYVNQWKSTFESFDRDQSGYIEANELHNALDVMGYKLSPQFAQQVIFKYDTEARRHITLDNFIQICVLLKSVTDSFKQRDTQMKGIIQVGYEDFLYMVLLNKP